MFSFHHSASTADNLRVADSDQATAPVTQGLWDIDSLIAPINGGRVFVNGLVVDNSVGGGSFIVDRYVVRVTNGVLLARKPVKLSKTLFFALDESEIAQSLYDMFIDRFFDFIEQRTGKKSRRTVARISVFRNIFLHLVNCYLSGSQLVYKRGHHSNDWRNIEEVADFMAKEGLVVSIIGKNNTVQKNASWMVPTPSFGAMVDRAKFILHLKNDDSLVELRDRNKKSRPLSRVRGPNKLALKDISNVVQLYSTLWEDMSKNGVLPTLDDSTISPFCKRIFNLLNDFSLGGRWYGAFQNITKKDRERILIGGESTVEPDWRSMHFAILYAEEGIQLSNDDDPYSLEGFDKKDRKWIKFAMLQLINCENESVFIRKITYSGSAKGKKIYDDYQRKRFKYEQDRLQGRKCSEPAKHDSLEGFIPGVPNDIKGEDLLAAIKQRHSKIAHRFCKPNLGLHLQNFDSEIMARVIQQLVAIKIPVLPIHDSLRCRESDCGDVIHAMTKAYRLVTKERTGTAFDCVIDY